MNLKKIVKLKNGKYKIELDNNEKIITYDEVILEENILYKKELNDELINKINIKNDYYKIYNKTLKYVMTKIRSEKEVNIYLKKQNISGEDIEKIINNLKNNHLLNDDMFYKSYISDRIRLSTDGPIKIKNYLLEHKIDENLINKELNKYDEEIDKKIEKLIEKKVKINTKYSKYYLKQKIKEYLINLGYNYDLIDNKLNNIIFDESSNLKKEYIKQYNKLSKKYKNNELTNKIKNSLYQKGYSIEEINKIL